MRETKYDDWLLNLVGVGAVASLLGLVVLGVWACFIWSEPTPDRAAESRAQQGRQAWKRFEREMKRTHPREEEEKYRKALERLNAAGRSGDPRAREEAEREYHAGLHRVIRQDQFIAQRR